MTEDELKAIEERAGEAWDAHEYGEAMQEAADLLENKA